MMQLVKESFPVSSNKQTKKVVSAQCCDGFRQGSTSVSYQEVCLTSSKI